MTAAWRRPVRSGAPVVAGVVTACVLAACSAPTPSAAPGASRRANAAIARPTTTTTSTTTTTTTTTAPAEPPGWSTVSTGPGGVAIDTRLVAEPDGSQVTLFRFRAGHVRFNLHDGSLDPPVGGATLGPDSLSTVAAAERPALLAAFNGGFESSAGAGGVEIDGQTLTPLVPGMASFVIDTDGVGRIGVWGATVPVPGEQVASVRQNLPPLIHDDQVSADIDDVAAWGATLGGGPAVARSALGEDVAGDILYAGSMSAVPDDLASALQANGATVALELDINPEWVQLDTAPVAGGPLSPGVPGQNRPSDQYLVGWTRDFVTVLAPA